MGRERSLANLKKAPKWRSPEESRLVRMFVWQWMLGRGTGCSRNALAKWLGVCTAHVLKLHKTLPMDEAEFEREVARSGAPTVEALREARIKSRSMRARGLLRRQLPFREINEPGAHRPKAIPTKPNNVTLVLDGKVPLQPPEKDAPRKKRQRKKRRNRLSREQAMKNFAKVWANYRPPRPWRSPAESRVTRLFVWQWLLGQGPQCSQRGLARWLGLSEGWVRGLKRKLPLDEAAYMEEVARHGVPTLDALARAREESRWMRDEGLLRTQRPLKAVKCEWNGLVHYEMIRTKPLNVTLALDGETPLEPPEKLGPGRTAPDEFSVRMWQLRMQEERKQKVKPVMPRRWGRR